MIHIDWGIMGALALFAACWLFALWGIFALERYLRRRKARRACCGDMDHREDG